MVLGVANVFADGLSMAASNYLKAKSDHETLAKFRRIEAMHIDQVPDAERAEIREIFIRKGFEGDTLEEARAMAADAIRCYLESLRKDGEPFPLSEEYETEPIRESVTVVLEPS